MTFPLPVRPEPVEGQRATLPDLPSGERPFDKLRANGCSVRPVIRA